MLSILLIGCNQRKNQKIDYSLVYNSDGYYLDSFKLSDIKFRVINKGNISYVGLTNDMLDKTYKFDEAGAYNITANYNDYRESVTFTLYDDASKLENSHNNYKKINNLYYDFSGNNLIDRISIDNLPSVLYVGNTFGLEQGVEYESSDPSIARINENNVLICLKKGKVNITSDDTKVKLNIEELELTSDTYYSTIGYLPELNSNDIKTILHNLIDEHNEGSFSSLKTILKESDKDPNNEDNMILFYTGRSQGGENDIENDENSWTREQIWPLSKLGGDTNLIAGHDAHNVKPVDVSIDELRGSLEFGYATQIIVDNYASSSSFNKISKNYFEPRDEVKGDVARILFYMATRYEGDTNNEVDLELVDENTDNNINYMGNLSVLLEWNEFDRVDSFEKNRNDVIYSYQNNRNPFIDYPSLVNLIWNKTIEPAKEYSVIYDENGYELDSFKLSDIKICIFDGEDNKYVDLQDDVLVEAYDFNAPGEYNLDIKYKSFETTIILILIGPEKEYSIVYEENGYDLDSFKLSDIKICEFDGKTNNYIDLQEDMITGTYDLTEAGEYSLVIKYESFEATIVLKLTKTEPLLEEWAYKDKTDIYNVFSGNSLNDRTNLKNISTNLYVGNTIGLTCAYTYVSSNSDVIKINDNNVLICLKKGSAKITASNGDEITISVSEYTLTSETYYSTIGYLP